MKAARFALVLLVTSCTDWRDGVKPGLAVAAPSQTPVTAEPTEVTIGGVRATVTARAHYTTRAWVVATDDDPDDAFAAVMPLDVALGWGPLGNPDILATMSFHLARRYVSVRWSGEMPLSHDAVMTHLSNHHLVPSSEAIAAYLDRVRPGDLLALEGHLVDVAVPGVPPMRTSLRRDDKGNGACEILWVERAEIVPPRAHRDL